LKGNEQETSRSVTALGIVLVVVVALGVVAVVGASIAIFRLIDLRVGPSSGLPQAAGSLDVGEIGRALDEAVRTTSARLPSDVRARVVEIRREIFELLPSTAAFPVGSEDLYVIQRTATDYLPAALQAYLALPDDYATTHPVQGGKTPLQLLREQLQLLDQKLDEITDAVHQQDSDRLVAHGRFLEERFGQRVDGLSLPPEG
jgi:hypothetical protein